jgi:hypothetical protein
MCGTARCPCRFGVGTLTRLQPPPLVVVAVEAGVDAVELAELDVA